MNGFLQFPLRFIFLMMILYITQQSNAQQLQTQVTILNPFCNGSSDGEVAIGASGGVPPYSFSLHNSDSSILLSNTSGIFDSLKAGLYYLHVLDDVNDTLNGTFTLTDPPLLQLTITLSSDTICTGEVIQAHSNVTGGSPGYTYHIDSGSCVFCPNPVINHPGLFTVTVVDNYGCTASKDTMIYACPGYMGIEQFDLANCIQMFPNPSSSSLTIKNLPVHSYLLVTNLIGEILMKKLCETETTVIDISELSPGAYFVNNKMFLKR